MRTSKKEKKIKIEIRGNKLENYDETINKINSIIEMFIKKEAKIFK